MDHIADLIKFMDQSPVNFFAVDTVKRRLIDAGFYQLDMSAPWALSPGDRCFVTKNDSAIFAFEVGMGDIADGFRIISSHSDSPGFRIKPSSEIICDGKILKLNTEVYGGPILYTWFDRPLSMAGRVILRSDDPLRPVAQLVRFHQPLLTIPHLAIHYNRSVNDGNPLSRQKDMLPVVAILPDADHRRDFVLHAIASHIGASPADILDYDLSLYDTTGACTVGFDDEFITSGRLDDLSMVHASLTALLTSLRQPCPMTRVMAVFDNEETGSGTKQGAASPMLDYLLRRIIACLGGTDEDYMRAVANSFMVSADNAHGTHPNYPEKQDPTNHPVLGGGPCIKINANCKYMTDADSAAVFRTICERADVPCQYFVNHSDVAGGSTLGNILTSQIPLRGVDMGAPLWAMHSVRETASTADHTYTIAAFTEFFSL